MIILGVPEKPINNNNNNLIIANHVLTISTLTESLQLKGSKNTIIQILNDYAYIYT